MVPRVVCSRSHLGPAHPREVCTREPTQPWVTTPFLPAPVSHFLCSPKYRFSIPAGHCLSLSRLQGGARTPTGRLARLCPLSPSSLSLSLLSLSGGLLSACSGRARGPPAGAPRFLWAHSAYLKSLRHSLGAQVTGALALARGCCFGHTARPCCRRGDDGSLVHRAPGSRQ